MKLASIILAASALACTACSSNEEYIPADETTGPVAIENIMTRTSVRQYTGRQIPADTVEILLKAAMAAPTAVNSQPWRFVVVNDTVLRAQIGDKLPNVGDKVKTAGAVIVVCGDSEKFFDKDPEYWVQDCSAATENLLLAANALKLGAVWCGVYPNAERVSILREILSLPTNLTPLNVIPVGYPTSVNEPKDKWNPDNVINL